MEEIINIDGTQFKLITDYPLTMEQKAQTITDIRRQSGCGCGNKVANLGGIYSLQGYPCVTVNLLAPDITVTDIKIGGTDCSGGSCPDMRCTSIGCTTDVRDVTVTYKNLEIIMQTLFHILQHPSLTSILMMP